MTAAWQQVLDELEVELETAERCLDAAGPAHAAVHGWQPPTGLTRIPAHLVPRAVELLTRQDALLVRLSEAASTVRRQISFVSAVPSSGADQHERQHAVFLDRAL